MKKLFFSLSAALLAATLPAADLTPIVSQAAKYESGINAEPLRQIEQLVREAKTNASLRAEVETALAGMLSPASTFEARRFACTQLAIMAGDASLPAIAELLKKPETVGMACLALGSNPSAKVNPLLRAALKDAEGMPRVQIINTLGDRRDDDAVEPLSSLTRNPDRVTAEAAVAALGKIANDAALKTLLTLLDAPSPEMVRVASLASTVAADRAAGKINRELAATIYTKLLSSSQPTYLRRAAVEGLMRLDPDEGEARALSILRGNDPALKPSAMNHARTLKSRGASAKFAKEMPKLTAQEQAQMIETLAARNDSPARDVIIGCLSAQDATVRQAAMMAVVEIGDERSVPALAKAITSAATPSERQTLEMAIASLKGGPAVDSQVIKSLKSSSGNAKISLINALARRGSQSSVPALLQETSNADAAVAKAAFRALGKLAPTDHSSALLNALATIKSPAVLDEAASAAAKALERNPDPARRYAQVSAAMAAAKDTEARCALISLLPVCAAPQALAAVQSARNDSNPSVRQAAFRALVEWPEATAIDPLLEIAGSKSQTSERVVALRGSMRLLSTASGVSDAVPRFEKAMAAARDLKEEKLVLASLANVRHPIALNLVLPFLDNPESRAEAALAAVTLAPYVCGTSRNAAMSALEKVTSLSQDAAQKQTAADLLDTLSRAQDFILAWQITGPFFQEGKDGQALFDVSFPPEAPGNPTVAWQPMPAATLKARPWQLDLGKTLGGNNRVAYARTWIYSETEQAAILELGSDDGIKAWFNGAEVAAANRGGDVAPGTLKAPITLKQGWNPLMLKVVQWTAGWGFCARIAKPDGSPIQGIRADLR